MVCLQGGPGKEKGRIELATVQAVEHADDEGLGRRPNGFQVRPNKLELGFPIY